MESEAQRIVATVCGPAPEEQARWIVRLIAQEAVRRKLVAGMLGASFRCSGKSELVRKEHCPLSARESAMSREGQIAQDY